MNVDDARRPGLTDNDRVRVYNDIGSFIIHVKPSPSVQPGEVIVYHAWENYQFQDWMQGQVAVPSPWKPQHIAGGYGHIRYRMFGLSKLEMKMRGSRNASRDTISFCVMPSAVAVRAIRGMPG